MKTAILQFDTIWEDKQTNLNFVQTEILSMPTDIDLIVLPEMFTTGFTMKPEHVAEEEQGITFQNLQKLAISKQTAITGSWVIKENNKYYNRLFFVFPDGSYKTYNKRHLFTLAGEEKVYTAGNEKLIVSYKDWNICLLVCYDLRFPIFSRIVGENYDILVYVASWPDRRINAWDALLKARAIENMSYVVAVNRCGTDPEGVYYSGHSQIIDCMGNIMVKPFEKQHTKTAILEKESLQKARAKFAFLNDADKFEMK
ncbi:nitrilase family protein [Flavobacterium sp. CBA20B-1]|uniref:nitrilase family protein n=1 Tax=unclassified Flavobacterium TaxID=196869 RepID=UPI00222442EB|nr:MULTISPECIES: nitrilase family protein [unclassified Flavobacterium]WCM41472.1 nitrilase family protein [Flavobacterium sp. CBA20B-1]